ncbi:hypothetical protein [Chlamydia sp.]|uniref:hypothetical protein n=1 Tax=Chlamydia sp. TaxID=35827 RepID=UPI0025C3CAED|nr:hypothetical protein [Chlamydia sp.]MBQ8498802.1 hypothetical protein [Chlamydia sp.]
MHYELYDESQSDDKLDLDLLICESDKTKPLDVYHETGVYIEEDDKENGDLLIVLGESVLNGVIRQFYISDQNYAYTRSYYQGRWESWFNIPPKKITTTEYNFDTLLQPDLLLTTDVKKLINAPEKFPSQNAHLDNMIICMTTLNREHRVQFLIGEDHRSFWIRHHDGKIWSKWTTFV